jgi:hypothetical protein
VISASGLPKGIFHQNFSLKSKLGCAWLEKLNKHMTVIYENFLERLGDCDWGLRKYFLSICRRIEVDGSRSCQFANTTTRMGENDEELADLSDQYKRAQRKFFIDLAKTLVDEKDAQWIWTTIFLLYSGAMTWAQKI